MESDVREVPRVLKCATKLCDNPRLDGEIFCSSCIVEKGPGTSCDDLPALADPSPAQEASAISPHEENESWDPIKWFHQPHEPRRPLAVPHQEVPPTT